MNNPLSLRLWGPSKLKNKLPFVIRDALKLLSQLELGKEEKHHLLC